MNRMMVRFIYLCQLCVLADVSELQSVCRSCAVFTSQIAKRRLNQSGTNKDLRKIWSCERYYYISNRLNVISLSHIVKNGGITISKNIQNRRFWQQTLVELLSTQPQRHKQNKFKKISCHLNKKKKFAQSFETFTVKCRPHRTYK
jgi:hypothetical protein